MLDNERRWAGDIYDYTLELKAEEGEALVSPEGVFKGFASTFKKDKGGDTIMKGAFNKTLQEARKAGRPFPMLWQHFFDEVIGVFDPGEMEERPKGLFVVGRLALGVQRAQEALELMLVKAIRSLSIGFTIPKGKADIIRQNDSFRVERIIHELKLFEISPVTFPMNESARITSVKCDNCHALEETVKAAHHSALEDRIRAATAGIESANVADAIRNAINEIEGATT